MFTIGGFKGNVVEVDPPVLAWKKTKKVILGHFQGCNLSLVPNRRQKYWWETATPLSKISRSAYVNSFNKYYIV